jgi:hypothetical protein
MENKPNVLVSLAAGLVILSGICALGTAAMSAAASAANAAAMTVMATTLQTSQCVIAILALAVIITPIAILMTVYRITNQAQIRRITPNSEIPYSLPRRRPYRALPDPETTQLAAILRDWSKTDEPLNRR